MLLLKYRLHQVVPVSQHYHESRFKIRNWCCQSGSVMPTCQPHQGFTLRDCANISRANCRTLKLKWNQTLGSLCQKKKAPLTCRESPFCRKSGLATWFHNASDQLISLNQLENWKLSTGRPSLHSVSETTIGSRHPASLPCLHTVHLLVCQSSGMAQHKLNRCTIWRLAA